MQWFLKMEHLSKDSTRPRHERRYQVLSAKYKNTYKHWLENIKDWCISRQLWWGHRIPAYFLPKGGLCRSRDTRTGSRSWLARRAVDADMQLSDLRQDEDCLGYLVLFMALAYLAVRRYQQPRQRRNQILLPHQRLGYRSGYHLLLGSTYDYGRL
jgi:valyl-tRNA synthetase